MEKVEEEELADDSFEDEKEKLVRDTDYVSLSCYRDRNSTDMLQEALEKKGIPSVVINRDDVIRVTDTPVPVSELILWVQDKDFEKAKEISKHAFENI